MGIKKQKADVNKTFKYGLGGGLLGAFIGAPGLGVVAGAVAANKDKIKKEIKKFDR